MLTIATMLSLYFLRGPGVCSYTELLIQGVIYTVFYLVAMTSHHSCQKLFFTPKKEKEVRGAIH